MIKAFKYRLYPNSKQCLWLSKNFGCCRFVFNQALHWRSAAYAADGTSLSYSDTNKALTQVKHFYPWLYEADSAALQMALQHLDAAFKNFFEGRANYPHFKSKHSRQSYSTPCNGGQVGILDGAVHLPKIHAVKADIHRLPLKGSEITSATVSMEPDGRYYVSITCECPEPHIGQPVDESKAIGLDMSMEHFFVDSNGDHEDLPHFYRKSEAVLAREQAKLSHMRKGSNNYKKQKRRIARIHAKIKHQRADWLHKLSYNLVQDYDVGEGSFYMAVDFSEKSIYQRLTFLGPWDFNWAYTEDPSTGYYASTFQKIAERSDRSNGWYILAMKIDGFREIVREKWRALSESGVLEETVARVVSECETLHDDLAPDTWKVDMARNIGDYVLKRIEWLNARWR